MEGDPTILGYRRFFLIAGAAGILIGIVHRRDYSWAKAIAAATSGASCVFFVAPGVVEFWTLKDGMAGLAYWGCGLGGMYIVDLIVKSMSNPWAALERWWKARGGQGGNGAPPAEGGPL